MQKRCFIYARVSTRLQAEEGYSIPEQIERLNKYADAMGWLVANVYVDPGHSGSTLDRPALQEMLASLDDVEIVLVDKLDRLSRTLADTLYLVKKVFEPKGVAFVSRAEAFDTGSPAGRATLGMLGVFAEFERERIRERMHDGMVGRVKTGLWHGNVRAGYKRQADGQLVRDEYVWTQVREIFDRALNRESLNDICKDLAARGLTYNGSPWSVLTIRLILASRAYLGEVPFGGEWYPGRHEPMITLEEHNKMLAILHERSIENERYQPDKRYTAPLGGLIWCKRCGAKYHYRRAPERTYKAAKGISVYPPYAYYSCYSRDKCSPNLVRDPNCKNDNYSAEKLDRIVYDQILALRDDPTCIANLRKSVDTSQRVQAISTRLAQLDTQIARLLDLFSVGSIPHDAIAARIEPLSAEKKKLENELATLHIVQKSMDDSEVVATADRFAAVLKSGSPQEIHDAVAAIVDYIEIDGTKIYIHWRI